MNAEQVSKQASAQEFYISHSEEKVFNLGRILYLTSDPDIIRKQIDGDNLPPDHTYPLMDKISTDEMAPNAVCLRYTGDEEGYLGKHLLTGLRGGIIKPNEIRNGGFSLIVAGQSYGRGSSRMHAQLAHKEAGIGLIVAQTERIFSENCLNYGIFTISDTDKILDFIESGEIPSEELAVSLPILSKEIVHRGGIMQFLKAFTSGEFSFSYSLRQPKPMTMTEKILAKVAVDSNGNKGLMSVAPGEQLVLQPDRYYGYELQTTVTRRTLGNDHPVASPEKLILYNDHTALLPEDDSSANTQREAQTKFISPLIPLGAIHYPKTDKGVTAICHTNMLEEHALPGELILGNDSHTCTLGAVNSLAIGKGAADLAGAIAYDRMVVTVPETIRFDLKGKFRDGVTSKDLMLSILAMQELKQQLIGSNRVFEFGGDGLNSLSFDQQIKLTNMAIEGQGYTGILEPNEQMINFLMKSRNLSREEVEKVLVYSDEEAEYNHRFSINLSSIEPTVALPGDTQNGVPLSRVVEQHVGIQKAYIGSCTHGTVEDLEQAANILKDRHVARDVELYVQASSLKNLQEAQKLGLIEIFTKAGAHVLLPGCGACMNAGPGATKEGEVGIFATNRNFPGRTGKGDTYLANPAIVAASAIKGEICDPDSLQDDVSTAL